jgi:NADP-dependent 3-hydroxy acid dehydrogenase YdfG
MHASMVRWLCVILFCDLLQDVDFWGYVYPTFYALPHLKRTHGKIIVNSSVAAWQPVPRMAIYNVQICS